MTNVKGPQKQIIQSVLVQGGRAAAKLVRGKKTVLVMCKINAGKTPCWPLRNAQARPGSGISRSQYQRLIEEESSHAFRESSWSNIVLRRKRDVGYLKQQTMKLKLNRCAGL